MKEIIPNYGEEVVVLVGGIDRFLGGRIRFEGTLEIEILEGVGGLSLSCLSFDFMGFTSIRILFAGLLFKNIKRPVSDSNRTSLTPFRH